MLEGHGDADYLLFVDRKAVGVIEAKKEGATADRRRVAVGEVHDRAPRQPSRR